MTPGGPLLRFAFGLLAVAVAIHIAWLLIRPVLPALAALLVTVLMFQIVRWHRNRW